MNDRAEEWTRCAYEARQMARVAINHWAGQAPSSQLKVGDRVWLEVKNLMLPYLSAKFAPRRQAHSLLINKSPHCLSTQPTPVLDDSQHLSHVLALPIPPHAQTQTELPLPPSRDCRWRGGVQGGVHQKPLISWASAQIAISDWIEGISISR